MLDMSPVKESLAERLKRSRAEAQLTQQKLADAAGISSAAIGLIEIGDTKAIRSENLFALARALNKSAEWLANGTGPERPSHALEDAVNALPARERVKILHYTKYVIDTSPDLQTNNKRAQYSARVERIISETRDNAKDQQ